jgi:hypothetical protein
MRYSRRTSTPVRRTLTPLPALQMAALEALAPRESPAVSPGLASGYRGRRGRGGLRAQGNVLRAKLRRAENPDGPALAPR